MIKIKKRLFQRSIFHKFTYKSCSGFGSILVSKHDFVEFFWSHISKLVDNFFVVGFSRFVMLLNVFDIFHKSKLMFRREVQFYTFTNFFAEVGGYLGLFLGESLVSYILIGQNWLKFIAKKCKNKCQKEETIEHAPNDTQV